MRLSLVLTLLCLSQAATAQDAHRKVIEVFAGDTTVAGERVVFPAVDQGVEALIVTLAPGEATGWHRHGTPLFGYILEGEVTVTYESLGERTYRQGAGFLEAMQVTHQGRNTGDTPCRILAVFLTGDGRPLTVPAEAPAQ